MSDFKPFHLAFPIRDIEETRQFYGDLLGCDIGRSTDKWIDFNFFGHQLSAHIKPDELANAKTNEVDGKNVPVRHFGAILGWDEWHDLADKLKAHGIEFVIELVREELLAHLHPRANAWERDLAFVNN